MCPRISFLLISDSSNVLDIDFLHSFQDRSLERIKIVKPIFCTIIQKNLSIFPESSHDQIIGPLDGMEPSEGYFITFRFFKNLIGYLKW